MDARFDFDTPALRRGTGCYKWDEDSEEGIVPMWVADMDFRVAPVVQQALQRRLDHGVFGYTLVKDEFYDAIVSWFSRRHGWTPRREWILYTSGVVPAVSVVVKAFCQEGDEVIVQTPVYNCFFSSIRNNGCQVVESPLLIADKGASADAAFRYTYEMDFDDLERKAASPRAKLLLLCNPHNPAGRVWTRAELERVAGICRRNGVVVVADEIHCELVEPGRGYVPFGTVDMDNAIVCTSPSKAFNTAGLQVANIICSSAGWRRRIDRAINVNEVCDVNPFGPEALVASYNEGEEWLDALRAYLWDNYAALRRFFSERLPRLYVFPLEGTYLVWVDVRPTGVGSSELADRLLTEGRVRVNSGTMYGTDGFIRINIACPREQLMEGLRRIEATLGSLP